MLSPPLHVTKYASLLAARQKQASLCPQIVWLAAFITLDVEAYCWWIA